MICWRKYSTLMAPYRHLSGRCEPGRTLAAGPSDHGQRIDPAESGRAIFLQITAIVPRLERKSAGKAARCKARLHCNLAVNAHSAGILCHPRHSLTPKVRVPSEHIVRAVAEGR